MAPYNQYRYDSNNVNFIHATAWGPRGFRAPHGEQRRPVKGGRWHVRKKKWAKDGRFWRAWTNGGAMRFSKGFPTQHEAIAHAQRVAWTFANPSPLNFERLIRATYPEFTEARIVYFVERYAKPERKNDHA